jgi:hypothetical protein
VINFKSGLADCTSAFLAAELDRMADGLASPFPHQEFCREIAKRLRQLDEKECPDAQPEQTTVAPGTDERKLQVRAEALRAAMSGLPMSGAKDIIERATAFENFLNGKSD